jgi:hypothetical protein
MDMDNEIFDNDKWNILLLLSTTGFNDCEDVMAITKAGQSPQLDGQKHGHEHDRAKNVGCCSGQFETRTIKRDEG